MARKKATPKAKKAKKTTKTRPLAKQERAAKGREPDCQSERQSGPKGSGGGKAPGIGLHLSKELYDEATKISKKAYRSLIKEAATARIKDKIGDRIESLVDVVVDELLADLESSMALESLVAKRKKLKKKRAKKARAALAAKKSND
jgi:hypothetical protein